MRVEIRKNVYVMCMCELKLKSMKHAEACDAWICLIWQRKKKSENKSMHVCYVYVLVDGKNCIGIMTLQRVY